MLEMFLVVGLLAIILAVYILCANIAYIILIDLIHLRFDMLDFTMILLMLFIVLLPIVMVVDNIQKTNTITETMKVEAIVVDKKHSPSRTNMIYSGKILVPIRVSEKWEITIKSKNAVRTLDDKTIYDSFKVGDRFKAYEITHKNKKGKVIDIDLEFK